MISALCAMTGRKTEKLANGQTVIKIQQEVLDFNAKKNVQKLFP